ncbi:DUF1697 domain-containing protein [Neobacillus sp. D3-1R]|uniref:DUF1697 domain-containing protein n=1 Tax=Neobacillus sp. D3-1R TaxID=3445778 RepID=UPI003F9EFAB6
MAIYVALLRGINVGGKNIIKMADLKHTFETIGLSRVKTYIQSGNVLFESEKEEITLRNQLENKIQEVFGLSVPITLRTADEFKLVAENCPFTDAEISAAEASAEGESLYVAFLTEEPHLGGYRKIQFI